MKEFSRNMLSLYLVTDRTLAGDRPLTEIVEEAVKGGVTMVQLREKDCPREVFLSEALELKRMLKSYGVPLIINDDVEVALLSGADGVHLGQSDMSPVQARSILGPDRIIGLSVENFDEVQQAGFMDVDYIAASPVFRTGTKTDTKTEFGIEGIRRIVRMSTLPVVGIGNMNVRTAGDVIGAEAAGVAVVSAIMASSDPRRAAAGIRDVIEDARSEMELIPKGRTRWRTLVALPLRMVLKTVENHPFTGDLLNGKLRYHRFRYWLLQSYFLKEELVAALKYLEVRLEDAAVSYAGVLMDLVRNLLDETVPCENEVYDFYFGGTPDAFSYDESEPAISLRLYLRRQVREEELHIALSCVLSYLMMFRTFGRFVRNNFSPESNRYVEWVNRYGSEEYFHDTGYAVEVADSVAGEVGMRQKLKMVVSFRKMCHMMMDAWLDSFADRDRPQLRDRMSDREDRQMNRKQ